MNEYRIYPNQTIEVKRIKITNKTANSIKIKVNEKEIEITDCCLEEQGK